MAAGFKVEVVGVNGVDNAIGDMVFSTIGVYATSLTGGISGANATVSVPKGAGSGAYTNYQVTEDLDEVLAALNTQGVDDLTIVDDLIVGGDITVNTDKFTVAGATGNTVVAGTLGVTGAVSLTAGLAVGGTLEVTGATTFNGDVVLGAGDDLTGSTTSDIIAFRTIAPIPTKPTAVAINATATMADGDFRKGYISSTSAAATGITTRTATELAAELGAVAGTRAYLVINNVAGANTVTLSPGASVTAASAVTGGTDMTVAATELATFMLIFVSTTVAQICRIQ